MNLLDCRHTIFNRGTMTGDSLGRQSQFNSPSSALVAERRKDRNVVPSLRDSGRSAARDSELTSQAVIHRRFSSASSPRNTSQERPLFRFATFVFVSCALAFLPQHSAAQSLDLTTQWRRPAQPPMPEVHSYPHPMTEFADGHVFPPIVDASDYLAQNSPNASKTTGGQPTTAAPTAAAKTGSQPESADNSAVEKLPDGKLKNAKETKPSDSSVKKDGGDTKKPPQDKSEKDDVKKEKPPEIDPRCCQSGCRHCGCRACGPHGKSSLDCCPSDYRCECRCEKEKVEHECFVVKCEAICVPPVRLPWGHGKFLCGGIKCVKKFSTDKYECEETVTKWSAKKIGGSCTD